MLPDLVRQHILERNKALHNRHAGERCFIIATGPSINGQNLKPLRNELCISLSNFFVHPDYGYIKPQYHCLAAFCNACSEEAWDAWMQSLDNALLEHNPEAVLLFPLSDIKRNSRAGTFAHFDPRYVDLSASPQELALQGIDLSKPILAPQSVPILAIQIALYMGVKEIYLLGCDHDWILSMHESRHFYQEDDHAVNRFYIKNPEWDNVDLEEQCRTYIVLWQQYKQLRNIAAQMGVTIHNATKGGLLDIFPRVSLDEVCPGGQPSISQSLRPEGAYGFYGDFGSWSEALQQCEGYDAPQILEKVCASTLKVKQGEAVYERDSVLFDHIPHEWITPLASWLSHVAAENDNRLNILDFGGSLGSTYFALKQFLGDLSDLKWSVVEQLNFVECGNRLIADGALQFYQSIDECIQDRKPSVILLSASLEYIERPYDLMASIIEYGFDYVIFDRTPLISAGCDRLTVQFVSPEIYNASYPAWFFSKEKFLTFFAGKYEFIAEFDAQDRVNIPSMFKGFVFRKIAPATESGNPWDAERSRYEDAGNLIRQTDTPEHKQNFLQYGCRNEQDYNEIKARRDVNHYLVNTSMTQKLSVVLNKPTYAIFEMSSACNLNCILCNTGGLKQHFRHVQRGCMSFETFKAGLDKLLPEIESILLYNWGEPLLNKDLFKCIAYAHAHKVHTLLSTNMMLYTEDIGMQLIKAGLSKLIVSCDGLNQETYQQYRQGGKLDTVIAGVENIVALKRQTNADQPHIEMQFVVFRFNENQREEYERFWRGKGVDSINFIQMSYMSKYGKELAEKLELAPLDPCVQPHYPYGALKSCSEFYNHVTIDWNGDWYTCCFPSGMTEYRIGNIVTDDFWTTWNNENYQYCRSLVRDQRPRGGYCETMCHDCTGIFPLPETKKYWCNDTGHDLEREEFLSFLDSGCSVLESGLSKGLGYIYFKQNFPGLFHYTALDEDEIGISRARQQSDEGRFFVRKGSYLFFEDNVFNFVICNDTGELLADSEYLDEMIRVSSGAIAFAEDVIDKFSRVRLTDLMQARSYHRRATYAVDSRTYSIFSR